MTKNGPINPRRRHFFRAAAAVGAMLPIALVTMKRADATPVFGDPPRVNPPGTNCLLAGTKVLADRGEVAVECLRVGDLVMTEAGVLRPIKGIGRNVLRRGPAACWSEDIAPVRISASAISPGVPAQDLYVSPGHALFIDGYLIPAKDLVNGLTITQDQVSERGVVEYLHLVFEQHEVFYAAGLAVESLLVSYAGEPKDLFAWYEDDRSIVGPMNSCAPRLGYFGGRQEVIALARLAVYPWIDVRDRIQIVYERLVARAQLLQADSSAVADAA